METKMWSPGGNKLINNTQVVSFFFLNVKTGYVRFRGRVSVIVCTV